MCMKYSTSLKNLTLLIFVNINNWFCDSPCCRPVPCASKRIQTGISKVGTYLRVCILNCNFKHGWLGSSCSIAIYFLDHRSNFFLSWIEILLSQSFSNQLVRIYTDVQCICKFSGELYAAFRQFCVPRYTSYPLVHKNLLLFIDYFPTKI